MPETYSPIIWRNDQSPAINENNLNRIEIGIEALDDRAAALELGIVAPVTVPYATSVTINATQGTLFRCTAVGDLTLDDIVGGANGQAVTFEVLASGGARTLHFTGSTTSVDIPTDQWWIGEFRYVTATDTWRLRSEGGSGGGSVAGGAGGVLSGTYPNPGFAVDMATQAELDAAIATRQPTDPDLTALAGLGDGYPLRSAGTWAARTSNQLATDLGVQDAVASTTIDAIVTLTQAEYDSITPAARTLYVVNS